MLKLLDPKVTLLVLLATSVLADIQVKYTEDGQLIFKSNRKGGSREVKHQLSPQFKEKPRSCATQGSEDLCLNWEAAQLRTTRDTRGECIHFELVNEDPNETDIWICAPFEDFHWFGGGEQFRQVWPTEKANFTNSYVTKQEDNQGIAERYWVTSKGTAYYVDSDIPLFIDQHNLISDNFCMIANKTAPYLSSRPAHIEVGFIFCMYDNAREAHENALNLFLGKPSGIPDERMIRHPIWSTWARYKRDVDESTVLEFADEMIKNGFNNSQLEIDDFWETCYGSLTFDKKKFPDMKALSENLKGKGFRVTLWVHPFINLDCDPYFSQALQEGYFVKDTTGNTNSSWWNGNGAVIDFTNTEAVNWWVGRLKAMMAENGIDSIKFDAGETSWLPQVPVLTGDVALQPNIYTTKYTEAVSQFGDMIEIRVGFQTQHLPHFVRMIDKDSKWDFRNGLPTLVTTLLQMNMVGYPFVLPDMVGGNGYGDVVTKELFIRWLQANVFMPAIQYSYVPWDFDNETIAICKKYTDLHAQYADKIVELMKKTVEDGSPVNPPIWWINPQDEDALVTDSEFLLGEDLLVAPVLKEGATSRDIYLPQGTWKDELHPDREPIQGRTWLRDYPAALDELPYFTRVQLCDPNSSSQTLPICGIKYLIATLIYYVMF